MARMIFTLCLSLAVATIEVSGHQNHGVSQSYGAPYTGGVPLGGYSNSNNNYVRNSGYQQVQQTPYKQQYQVAQPAPAQSYGGGFANNNGGGWGSGNSNGYYQQQAQVVRAKPVQTYQATPVQQYRPATYTQQQQVVKNVPAVTYNTYSNNYNNGGHRGNYARSFGGYQQTPAQVQQYRQAAPVQQYRQAAPVQQYKQVAQVQQYRPAVYQQQQQVRNVPAVTYNNYNAGNRGNYARSFNSYQATPVQQYKQVAPVQQYKQVAPVQQYKHVAPVQQYQAAAPVQQYQAAATVAKVQRTGNNNGYSQGWSAPSVTFIRSSGGNQYAQQQTQRQPAARSYNYQAAAPAVSYGNNNYHNTNSYSAPAVSPYGAGTFGGRFATHG